jgi:uncharacterized protein YbjQ (UPF0145 family)
MIITTTPSVEGKTIIEYKAIIKDEASMRANIIRDLFASITDIVGGRSLSYETKLSHARQVSLQEMEQSAAALGRMPLLVSILIMKL